MKLWDIIARRFRLRTANHIQTIRNRDARRPDRFRPAVVALEDRTVPVADMFADATVLTGVLATSSGTNVGATVEMGEPDQLNIGAVNSVWCQWTAPADGAVEVNTVGSDLDTVLAVYTGSAVDSLNLVNFNDDYYDLKSRVLFQAVADTTYWIQIDGYGDAVGPITLNLAMSPANDGFADATPIGIGTYLASSIGSTAEPGEPTGAATNGRVNSVWYVWTADTSDYVEFNTFGSDFDTILGVYVGTSIDSLTLIAANDDAAGGFQSQVTFDPTLGTTYYIAIDGFGDETGSIVLNHPSQSSQTNDPPVIPSGQTFSVDENSFGGTIVGTVVASDPNQNQEIRFDIIGGNTDNAFFINPQTGRIVVNDGAPLDHEINPTFSLVVRVTDNGTPELSTSAIVTINVDDQEDPPIFDAWGPFFIAENSPTATTVGTVSAHDLDPGQTVSYSIRSGNTDGAFSIDSRTGVITVANPLAVDYETTQVFSLEVIATDTGAPPLSSSQTVVIFVTNGNEAPVIADQSFAIDENSALATLAGVVVATDPDGGQTLTYSIVGGNEAGAFAIDPQTGWITVVDRQPLDFEVTPEFSLTVQVADDGVPEMSSTATVTIDLTDVNEAAVFTQSGPFSVDENSAFGTLVGTVSAVDQDHGQTLKYFIVGGNAGGAFAIDSETGAITVTGTLDYELRPNYALAVLATDSGEPALNVATTVVISLADVNDAPVLDNAGEMALTTINQGAVNNGGTLVSTILASTGTVRVTDQDVGAVQGIAIIAADTSHGTWQFSTDGGATWWSLGAVSERSARLLAAGSLVRFVPAFGFNGTVVEGITFRAWDQTSGINGCLADASANGDGTAFSSAIESASIKVRSAHEQVVLLMADVRELANIGALSSRDANQLLTKLTHAKKQIEYGNLTAAENQVRFFRNQVLDLMNSGDLAPVYAEDLMTKADAVIVSLNG
jgi:VCBS repeat-containing protein